MENNEIPVITIDGPSGSGKGTISKLLAQRLGWNLLDSGALYRVLAYYSQAQNISIESVDELSNLAENLPITFGEQILVGGEDVTDVIRTEQCGLLASKVAVIPAVRAGLLQYQQNCLKNPGLVADGRDMGTVVFPAALLKVYLDASIEERAKRRLLQLKQTGLDGNLQSLEEEIRARDHRDKTRVISPLKPAEDAVVLDTSSLTITEVFEKVLQVVESRQPNWLKASK